jgi:hypothetical protein
MLLKSLKYNLSTIFFILGIVSAFSDDFITPKKKPILNSSNIIKKIPSNFIIPQEKPGKNQIVVKKIEKIKEKKIKKIGGIIIPKNKPLIVKKERLRKVKKSKYYSDRDINYAKQAITFMEKSNWKDAKKTAKKSKGKINL